MNNLIEKILKENDKTLRFKMLKNLMDNASDELKQSIIDKLSGQTRYHFIAEYGDSMKSFNTETTYYLHPGFFSKKSSLDYKYYELLATICEQNERIVFDGLTFYQPGLFYLFTTKHTIPLFNKINRKNATISWNGYFELYKEAFYEGKAYFNNSYSQLIKELYNNTEICVQTLKDQFFSKKDGGFAEIGTCWQAVKYAEIYLINNEIIKKHGYYSGIVSELQNLIRIHPVIFENFTFPITSIKKDTLDKVTFIDLIYVIDHNLDDDDDDGYYDKNELLINCDELRKEIIIREFEKRKISKKSGLKLMNYFISELDKFLVEEDSIFEENRVCGYDLPIIRVHYENIIIEITTKKIEYLKKLINSMYDDEKANIAKKDKPDQFNDMKVCIKPDIVETIFNVLQGYFTNDEQKVLLRDLIITGNESNEYLIFSGNANKLLDLFKKLIECNFITGCDKTYLQNWIIRNFNFVHRKKTKNFVNDTAVKTISRNYYPCKNPLINIIEGEIIPNNSPYIKKQIKN